MCFIGHAVIGEEEPVQRDLRLCRTDVDDTYITLQISENVLVYKTHLVA